MNLSTAIYLTEFFCNMKTILLVLFIIGSLLMVVAGMIYLMSVDNDDKDMIAVCKPILKKYWVLILMLVISAPIPTKNAMYLMLGSSYLEQSNIPTKVSQALELKLDDYIKELRGTKE